MNNIEFENNIFPVREVHLSKFGGVFISTNKLNNMLVDMKGNYVSPLAEKIDELIFFFVDDSEIILGEKNLSKIIQNQLA